MTAPGSSGWAPRADYRRSAWAPRPARHEDIFASSAPDWDDPVAMRPARRRRVIVGLLVAAGVIGTGIMFYVLASSASSGSSLVQMTLLALVPLTIVLTTVWWIDRWEPEPLGMLLLAFLWGVGVSTAVSLIANTSATVLLAGVTDDFQYVSAVVIAPLVEESTKGLGVLFIFLLSRRSFNGAVDGIVYAAVVAAGFAFSENILYFLQNQDDLARTFVLRGIMSPFAHIMFTSCAGVAIGASARMRSRLAWLWTTPMGLAGAICLHAFWNGALSGNLMLYFIVEVPLFVAAIALVLALRWRERLRIRARLREYGQSGWYHEAEIIMLTTSAGRRAARRWARRRGPEAKRAMRDFQAASVQLANLRQGAMEGHAVNDFAASEKTLLARVMGSRAAYMGKR
ncbi:PrsW family intramembrane metalloprotease [Actinomyces gaoshouyii]|uniref:Protease PrsW n=1 Tax=Actinomyces gaoshouyii TaxID=1960083 RepID=A0A8H9LJ55_9ACTO|nr:PrsW family intramembrane metalloprotease [Actinomyces gaoshouyii]ARD41625.1 PrsW family intramembrane metalloprotease [Actinomyces gaoshouyii]GGO98071.1 protease PrsW [Actinomyces gaoshouyii]